MYADAVLADNPLRYWRLEETSGSTVTDTAAAASGTVVGGVNLDIPGGTANLGSAAQFNGSTGRINMAPVIPARPFTIEAWGRTTSVNWGTIYAESQASTGSNNTIQVGFNGGGTVEGSLRAGTAWANVTSAGSYNDGQWHHIAVTFVQSGSGTDLTVYVDGVQDGAGTIAAGFPATIHNAAIGVLPRSNATDWLNGGADEVAIYNYALSPARIAAHYTAAFATRWQRGDGIFLRPYLKTPGGLVDLE